MAWFRNLKIKSKLVTCFIIISLFAGIIGAMGIYNMDSLNDRTIQMYYDRLVPIVDLSEVQKDLYIIRANFLSLIHERDESQVIHLTNEINSLYEDGLRLLDKFGKTLLTKDEEHYLALINQDMLEYGRYKEDLIRLVKGGDYDGALRVFPQFVTVRSRLDENLARLVEINTNKANALYNRNVEDFKSQLIFMIAIVVGGIALAITLGLVIANLISKPLSKLVIVADKIANGDLDVNVDIDTKDEVGMLAKSFRNMTDNMNDVMSNISSSAQQVAAGSKQVSESSMELSQGATEQASSIEELTASIEEISSQTKQNAENSTEANELAEDAKGNASKGKTQMTEMLRSMDEINESSSNISKIIKVIDEIAFQTNILALNAAVEAARAGQHGKGFAVVAEEVRNLAARSANAAKETTTMIEGSIKKVEDGTKIANETAAASEELSSQSEMLNEMVARFNLKKRKYNSHKREDEGNSDVFKMIDSMGKNKKSKNDDFMKEVAATKSKRKIELSDNEFGKY